jgi:hypothetical protein
MKPTFSPEHVEKIARQWAVIEGKGELFDLCKASHVTENEFGHYEGYLADAYALLSDYPDLEEITPEIVAKQWQ